MHVSETNVAAAPALRCSHCNTFLALCVIYIRISHKKNVFCLQAELEELVKREHDRIDSQDKEESKSSESKGASSSSVM